MICDDCDRRMHGKSLHKVAYYACEPDMRHHKDRRDWYASHPKSLRVREDDLSDLVHEFFATRVFTDQRIGILRDQLRPKPSRDGTRSDRLKEILDLGRRQAAGQRSGPDRRAGANGRRGHRPGLPRTPPASLRRSGAHAQGEERGAQGCGRQG
ncbi:hypothetical protein ACWDA3_04705 [Nonomuraea rubra]